MIAASTAASTASTRVSVVVRSVPRAALTRGRPNSTATASARPTQAATTVPVIGLPVTAQTTARSIRPPSSGRPGSRLKAATTTLETIRPVSSTPGTVESSTARTAR